MKPDSTAPNIQYVRDKYLPLLPHLSCVGSSGLGVERRRVCFRMHWPAPTPYLAGTLAVASLDRHMGRRDGLESSRQWAPWFPRFCPHRVLRHKGKLFSAEPVRRKAVPAPRRHRGEAARSWASGAGRRVQSPAHRALDLIGAASYMTAIHLPEAVETL